MFCRYGNTHVAASMRVRHVPQLRFFHICGRYVSAATCCVATLISLPVLIVAVKTHAFPFVLLLSNSNSAVVLFPHEMSALFISLLLCRIDDDDGKQL